MCEDFRTAQLTCILQEDKISVSQILQDSNTRAYILLLHLCYCCWGLWCPPLLYSSIQVHSLLIQMIGRGTGSISQHHTEYIVILRLFLRLDYMYQQDTSEDFLLYRMGSSNLWRL